MIVQGLKCIRARLKKMLKRPEVLGVNLRHRVLETLEQDAIDQIPAWSPFPDK